jgi:hypothetical protein
MNELNKILSERRSKLTPEIILEARRLQKKFIREDMDEIRSNRLYKFHLLMKSKVF